ncbi:GNAT family N-acetyltransferase [bacterium]|nr:GNAT family N-acetyltransferase [bacterium]
MTQSVVDQVKDRRPIVLTIHKIDSLAEFEGLEGVWNELLAKAEFETVFQMHQWYRTWWKVFGDNRRLYILQVNDSNRVVGIAPLMITGGTIEFIGAGNTDYADIIADKSVKREVVQVVIDYLREHRADWQTLILSQITERSLTVPALRDILAASGMRCRIEEIEQCYAYAYEGTEEERGSFEAGLNNYRNLRNAVNYFNKNGGMEYRSYTEQEEIEKRLPQVFKFHWNRWKDTPTPSKFLNDDDCRFYYEITRTFAPLGIARLETLTMGGAPVAYVYSFDYKQDVFLYTAALNTFYNKKSPGIVLYYQITDQYIRRGHKSIDYLRGGEQYKGRLTNRAYGNFRVAVYNSALRYRLVTSYQNFKQTSLGRMLVGNKHLKELQLKLGSEIRHRGVKGLLKALPATIWKRIFDYRVILVWTMGEPQPPRDTKIPVTVRKLTAEDIDRIATFYGAEPKSRKYGVLQERFENNADCYAAFHNDIMVAILWGEYGKSYLYEIDKFYQLKDGEIALVDGVTLPQLRGHRIQPYLLAHAMRDWWEAKLKTLSFTMSDNYRVFPVLRKGGGTVTGKVRSLRLFGKEVFRS